MGWIIGVLIFVLNAFDGVATHVVVSTAKATELNPIVAWAISVMGVWFLLPKILVGLVAAALIKFGWEKLIIARIGGYFVLTIYCLLALYHTVIYFLIMN